MSIYLALGPLYFLMVVGVWFITQGKMKLAWLTISLAWVCCAAAWVLRGHGVLK